MTLRDCYCVVCLTRSLPSELRFDLLVCSALDLCSLPCRISYCTADKLHDKVFAYIAQNTLNGTLECHAYLCSKRKVVSCPTRRSIFFAIDRKGCLKTPHNDFISVQLIQYVLVLTAQPVLFTLSRCGPVNMFNTF